jgi:hypothetical protein
MVLADNNFGVHAEFAGTTEDFDNAASGCGAATRITEEFDVDDSAVEFGNVGKTLVTAGFPGGREKLFAESCGEFFAGQELDVVLDARIIRGDHTAAGSIVELADDGWMRAADNAHNAPFGTARAGVATEAGNFSDDMITMHGIFDGVARDKNIAIHVGQGNIWYNEAVAILMKYEAALDFVAGRCFLLRDFFWRWFGSRSRIATRAAKQETSMGKLLNEAAGLQFGEHLEEGTAVTFLHLEAAREIFYRDGIISKLKKTKDIVEIQVGGARHSMALSGSGAGAAQF